MMVSIVDTEARSALHQWELGPEEGDAEGLQHRREPADEQRAETSRPFGAA